MLQVSNKNHHKALMPLGHLNRKNPHQSKQENNVRSSADMKANYYQDKISCCSDPVKWFMFADKDNDGFLSQEDIITTLNTHLCPRNSRERLFLHKFVKKVWRMFGKKINSSISLDEFLRNNMIKLVVNLENERRLNCDDSHQKFSKKPLFCKKPLSVKQPQDLSMRIEKILKQVDTNKPRRSILCNSSHPPPPLLFCPEAWFDYFDINRNQSLSQKQVINGLYVTLNAITQENQLHIQGEVASAWDEHSKDKNGTITKKEFLEKNGLSHSLVKLISSWPLSSSRSKKYWEIFDTKVTVCIPEGMTQGDITETDSPRTQERILVMIPEKSKWRKTCDGTSNCFTVML